MDREKKDYRLVLFFILFIIGLSIISIYITRVNPGAI